MDTGFLSDVVAWASAWPEGLWRASWQGALGAVLAWVLSKAWPRMPASLRAGLWWLVALKFVMALGWVEPVALPLLPARAQAPVARVEVSERATPLSDASRPVVDAREVSVAPWTSERQVSPRAPGPLASPSAFDSMSSAIQALRAVSWTQVVVLALGVAWMLGVAWQVRGHVRSWLSMRRLRRSARPVEDAALVAEVRALCESAGLRRVPRLLVSESVASPLATGLVSPVVMLPAKAVRRLPVDALRMALAHELAHLRRGDLWLGWVPALAEALLFFHPLARRSAREYALAREEACDAEALRLTGAEPADYGELLLAFGVARPHGTAAALGASAHVHALHRRLSMLEHVEVDTPRSRRLLKVTLSALGLAALVPFQVVAQEGPTTRTTQVNEGGKVGTATTGVMPAATPPTPAAPRSSGVAAPPTPAAPAAPRSSATTPPPTPAAPRSSGVAAPPTPPAPMAPLGSVPVPPAPPRAPAALRGTVAAPPTPPAPVAPLLAAAPPTPPSPPRLAAAPPAPPRPPPPPEEDDDDGYVFVSDGKAMMNGSTVDLQLARTFQQKGKDLLYVRRKDEAFLIRDPETLKTVAAALESQRKLGEDQGALGDRQGKLGDQQGALGEKQAAIGQQQAELGMKQAELGLRRAQLSLEERQVDRLEDGPERDRREAEVRKREEALDKDEEALEKQMEALSEQQEALGREQEKLGEQQEALGREQEKLSRQQEVKIREAEKKLRALIDEALRKGLGEPLPT